MWLDECHTLELARMAQRAPLGRLVSAGLRGISTYFMLLAPWVGPETPEWVVRLPSALAGIALPLVLVFLGRDLGGRALGWRLGMAAALSPFLVWHSREARWYPLTWLLVGIGALCFVRARRNGDWRWVAGCLAAGLAAASTYAPAVTIPLIQLAWLGSEPGSRSSLWGAWLKAGRRRNAILGVSLAGGLLAGGVWLWGTLLAPILASGPGGYKFVNVGGPRLGAVGYTGIAYATGYTLGPGPSEWHVLKLRDLWGVEAAMLALGAGAFGVLMLLGLVALRRQQGRSLTLAILTLAVAPPLLVVAAGWWTNHVYAPRYAGMAYPFALVLGAAGLAHPTRRGVAWALAALVVSLQIVSLWNLHTNPRYSREDVRSAARYIAAHARPGDLVLIFGELDLTWKHYYRGAATWKMVKPRGEDRSDERQLRADLDLRSDIWMVRGRLWHKPGSERLISIVEERAPATQRREFPGSVLVTLHPMRNEAPMSRP